MDVITGPVLRIVITIVDLYMWIIIIGVVLSWLIHFNVINTSNRFVYLVADFLYRMTEPVLGRIRRFLPNLGGIDIAPLILILALILLRDILIQLAYKVV
ncbi:MAG: YggT family protein [Rhodospirillales bacterium]|jgi:YggT family protein